MSSLLSKVQMLAWFVAVFGVVISFHELGHFLAAKAFGVRVDVFSIGFGRRLWGFRRGETEYRVAVVPLGGYVLMSGEMGGEEDRPRDPRDFDAQPFVSRLVIMLAGPVFSALLAVLIMWAAFMSGVETPAYLLEQPRVGSIAASSPAAAAGLQPGDLVVRAAGRPVHTWEDFSEVVLTSPNARIEVEVLRGDAPLTLPVDVVARTKHRIGWIGADPCIEVVVHGVARGSAAEAAGLRPGDRFAAIDGTPPCSTSGVVALVQASAGQPLQLDLVRDGQPLQVTVAPRWDQAQKQWLMGIGPAPAMTLQRYGVGPALVQSLRFTGEKSLLVVDVLSRLATGRMSIYSTSSPIEIATMTQEAARIGFMEVVQLVAAITINVAVFNLLPIPILDGGKILLLVIEAIRGRELERRTKEWILQAGLVMILLLMVTVVFVDVLKIIEG